jgi:hypothetical protein
MSLKLVVLTICGALLAGSVEAQTISAPRTVQQEVMVTQSSSGEELRGRLLELSPRALAILVHGRRVEVPIDEVLRIDVRGDSVKNGALIGAAIIGGLSMFGCVQGFSDSGECAAILITNVGLGALVGAGVDAMIKGRSTIYARPAMTTAGRTARLSFSLRF